MKGWACPFKVSHRFRHANTSSILRLGVAVQEITHGATRVLAFVEHGVDLIDDGHGDFQLVREAMLHEKTKDYELTQYTGTLNVFVPDVCPCCGE